MIRKWNSAAVLAASLSVVTAFTVGGTGSAAAAAMGAAAKPPAPATVAPAQAAPPRPAAAAAPARTGAHAATASSSGYPVTPPAQICGNSSLLAGPATQPAGSVRIDPGQDINTITLANPAGTTFWLSPGTFTLGSSPYGQVDARANDTYIGAPGAIIDGQGLTLSAFDGYAAGVTVEYLTIQGFVTSPAEAAVNHESAAGWTIQYNTIKNNNSDGINVGNNTVIRYNCITANGQQGINGIQNLGNETIDHNEISYNGTGPHAPPDVCGCSGNVKLFGVSNVVITSNWVHHSGSQGLFGDTNAIGWLIEGNYLNDNFDEAIVYEASYNIFIHNNNIVNNTVGKGSIFAARNDSFPIGTVYLSEAGGDSRVYGGKYATLEVSGNNFDNNWGGIVLWEDPNRFCNSVGNTAPGMCPQGGAATVDTCVQGTISNPPYTFDCRWHTQNVLVSSNTFRIDTDGLGCTGTRCGQSGIFSAAGTTPFWSPYQGNTIENAITFNQNNHFQFNTYIGNWNFDLFTIGNQVNPATWQAAPYGQDTQSTFTPLPMNNAVDPATSTLESSIGHWSPWFSTSVAQTNAQSHSGGHSLQVNITQANGWGVQLNNFPYFSTQPGGKVLTFWAMATSGNGLAVTMQVTWRDNSGNVLQTDNVTIPALTSAWQQGLLLSNAPAGTSYVGLALDNAIGVSGNVIYVDDVVIADNALDINTTTIEGSTGHWAPWFSSTIAQSSAQAHTGSHSLQVNVTAPFGWGVTLNNHPYFPSSPGTKTLSFWARAGSGTALTATLQATWRDAYGNILQTDKVTSPTLTTSWQQVFAMVTAPAGTERVGLDLLSTSGKTGDSLFVDDVVVVNGMLSAQPPPPPPNPNAVDLDTSTLEGSIGQWAAWFSCTIAQSTAEAHIGTHSLQVTVTNPFGWGVTLNNWPYFPTSSGPKTISFWGMAGSGSGLAATMQVVWLNSSAQVLRTDSVTIPALNGTWQQASAVVTPPAGAATLLVNILNPAGVAGNVMYFDDIAVNG